ncbi:MAG: hypothetical protein ACR2HD_03250 [Solirubrobacteraceae bacterium]
MERRPLTLAVAAVALGLAYAGCGGGSGSSASSGGSSTSPGASSSATTATALSPAARAYLQQVQAAVRPWALADQTFTGAMQRAGKRSAQATAIAAYAGATNTLANQVAALTPPSGVQSQQNDLVVAIRQLDGALTQLAQATTQANTALGRDAQSKAASAVQQIRTANTALLTHLR